MANLVNINKTVTVIGIMYKIKSKILRDSYYELCTNQYEHYILFIHSKHMSINLINNYQL